MNASVLSDAEAIALGLSPVANGMAPDPDNMAVESLLSGSSLPQEDNEGRPVISFRQFQEIRKLKGKTDRYAMRMFYPGKAGTYFIQASKYLKWVRFGYKAVGDNEGTRSAPKAVRKPEATVADADTADTSVKIFFCADKYADCGRFFDTKRGLEFHWRKEHGESPIRKPSASKRAPDGDAEE